jgi:hypothetical protein
LAPRSNSDESFHRNLRWSKNTHIVTNSSYRFDIVCHKNLRYHAFKYLAQFSHRRQFG